MMSPTEWREWTELIKALTPLAWPIVVVMVAMVFRRPIEAAASRATHFGAKVPLGEFNVDLGQQLTEVLKETAAAREETVERMGRGINEQVAITAEDMTTIRAVEAESPTAALALVGIFIEKALRDIAQGSRISSRTWSLGGFTAALEENGILPPHLARALRGFAAVRNQLVHGVEMDDETVRRAVNAGLDLLWNVRALATLQDRDQAER